MPVEPIVALRATGAAKQRPYARGSTHPIDVEGPPRRALGRRREPSGDIRENVAASGIATPGGAIAAHPVVAMRDISKRFGPVQANDRISLDLWPGEIHAVLGENGAGKTTLMNILSGMYQPDAGDDP